MVRNPIKSLLTLYIYVPRLCMSIYEHIHEYISIYIYLLCIFIYAYI
jgi:hypothetical protein